MLFDRANAGDKLNLIEDLLDKVYAEFFSFDSPATIPDECQTDPFDAPCFVEDELGCASCAAYLIRDIIKGEPDHRFQLSLNPGFMQFLQDQYPPDHPIWEFAKTT